MLTYIKIHKLPLIFFKKCIFAGFLLHISVDILQMHSYILLMLLSLLILTSIVISAIRILLSIADLDPKSRQSKSSCDLKHEANFAWQGKMIVANSKRKVL